jgi:outer membrane protein OmpA-like peptidoglycan-associated protein
MGKMLKKIGIFVAVFALAACAGNFGNMGGDGQKTSTPTVDYVEGLDISRAEHNDSFLSRLALNYRSFAIFNARVAGDAVAGEIFAQKAVAAFSGELPYPENPTDWGVRDPREFQGMQEALVDLLRGGAPIAFPDLAAETQAKFDCWVSATGTGIAATAHECRAKFNRNMSMLADKMEGMTPEKARALAAQRRPGNSRNMNAESFLAQGDTVVDGFDEQGRPIKTMTTRSGFSTVSSSRDDGRVVVVNNINIPENLIRPIPVSQPVVFNQKIFHNGEEISESDEELAFMTEHRRGQPDPNFVSRDEFINMMLALREELAAINGRMDGGAVGDAGDEDVELTLKIQQIPLTPQQSIMEEVFEVRFDFNKSDVSPEYREIIRKLAETAQNNKNVKITVVGHTDTVGSKDFNFALGGRRAESVRKLLVNYGIPASQIVSVSSGMNDLKVPTGPGVKNAENRRVRVVKETTSLEAAPAAQGGNIKVMVDGDARVNIVEQ